LRLAEKEFGQIIYRQVPGGQAMSAFSQQALVRNWREILT
jgi:hypothetical protein